ncbi:hypothetical protein, partial [Mycolicibacterium smegmatis]|uniref:hypothetical protein n=1 Tax=Mycolicibacterium smegmatis TaxID=1772 RepID=UPI001D164762
MLAEITALVQNWAQRNRRNAKGRARNAPGLLVLYDLHVASASRLTRRVGEPTYTSRRRAD